MSSQYKSAYQLSLLIADAVWNIVQFWSVFSKTIIGEPYVNCLDNITIYLAKIGQSSSPIKRKMFKEKLLDLITEALIWHDKAKRRELIDRHDYQIIYIQLNKLNNLVSKTN